MIEQKAGKVSKIPNTNERNTAWICKIIFFDKGYFLVCFKLRKSPIW